jgi:hypothetical protein
MIEHLSENIDDWPVSPYEIIGVSRLADRSDIRRSYSVLLRRFRPESHPRHFQRIREAYEAVMAACESHSRNSSEIESDLRRESADGEDTNSSRSMDETRIHQDSGSSALADRLWEEFTVQPAVSQYSDLFKLAQSESRTADVFLMGYWMLKLRPDFSLHRRPAEWLMVALKYYGAEPRFIELLIDEFRRDSSLTAVDVSGTVADRIMSSELLCIYLVGRWNVLGNRRDWKQLRTEVEQTRPRISLGYSDAWCRILSRVFEMTAFSSEIEGRLLFDEVSAELNAAGVTFQNRLLDTEMMDIIGAVRQENHGASLSGCPTLDRLIHDCTVLDQETFRQRVFQLIQEWLHSPVEALQCLTRLWMVLPEALLLVLRHVDGLGFFHEDVTKSDFDMIRTVEETIKAVGSPDYSRIRNALADLSLNECLSGTEVLDSLLALRGVLLHADDIAEQMQRDTPLLLTCQLFFRFLEASGPTSRI